MWYISRANERENKEEEMTREFLSRSGYIARYNIVAPGSTVAPDFDKQRRSLFWPRYLVGHPPVCVLHAQRE